jgi:hypothetical protein
VARVKALEVANALEREGKVASRRLAALTPLEPEPEREVPATLLAGRVVFAGAWDRPSPCSS